MKFFKIYEKFTCHQHKILKSKILQGKIFVLKFFWQKFAHNVPKRKFFKFLEKLMHGIFLIFYMKQSSPCNVCNHWFGA